MVFGVSWLDWKLGGRMLVKYPGLSVIGGLTLAVAIGLGAAWFEVTRQLLKPRLPFDDGDRIVSIHNWDAAESEVEPRSLYDFQVWREQITTVKQLGAYRSFERNLITPDGNAAPAAVAEITASAFLLTRVPPLLGRTLLEADAAAGSGDVVVIGYDLWQRRFNGQRDVIGRTVRLGRTPATIVGVMPEGFRFPVNQQVWLPLRVTSIGPREGPSIGVFGRLADGASLESAQAELTTIGQRMTAVNAATHRQLRPLVYAYGAPANNVTLVGPAALLIAAPATVLLRLSNIIAWLILATGCVNVATLMFARTAAREAEIVVRNALGASRKRVMMQLLVEAMVLCLVAAALGLMAASWALDFGVRIFAELEGEVPFWWQFNIRPATVAYAAALAVCGAVLVGLLPAIRATGPRVQTAVAQLSAGGSSMRSGGVWSVLIVLQVAFAALALPLGIAATYWTLHDENSSSAFPLQEYLTFRPQLDRDAASVPTGGGEASAATDRAQMSNVYEELKRRLESEPSVAAVTFGNGMPRTFYPLRQVQAQRGSDPPFLVDADIESDYVKTAAVDISYFDAFRMPLVAGRVFHAGDVAGANVVIINETLARNIGGNPLGVRIRYAQAPGRPAGPWWEVVGVVRDAGVYGKPADFVFQPTSAADISPLSVAVHVRGNGAAFAPRLRAVATQVEPELRLNGLLTLDEVVRRGNRHEILGMFAMLAVMLVVVGLSAAALYSLMSIAVTRRTREIGIRLAIGASPRAVLTALFARAAVQVGIGIALANALLPSLMNAIGISELNVSLVVKAMLIASVGMLLVGLLACGVPARRALRIPPTEAMRYVG